MITDPEAIKFSDEQVRPYCEKMRNLYWEFKSLTVYWQNTMSAMIPDDPAEILVDGRESDTELTGEDIRAFVVEAGKFVAQMEAGTALSDITKPCVRHLQSN